MSSPGGRRDLLGTTTDDKPVLAGVSVMTCTHGIPLELRLAYFQARGLAVDWWDYIRGCLTDGHKTGTIRSRVLAAVGNVYGLDYLAGFAPRLEAALDLVAG